MKKSIYKRLLKIPLILVGMMVAYLFIMQLAGDNYR